MNENIEVTPQQLLVIRRLAEDGTLDTANNNFLARTIDQLIELGMVERNEQNGAFLTTQALRLLAE